MMPADRGAAAPVARARATALALVNWKGVFYERYLLDRHVTALEGANGAGKTTVMIAAYVVLLPDLVRLRFTNLGETAATGGDRGLYGRLGEPGRPSYAALELELGDGARVLAGVMLVRKSEPTLELTPFLVTGLDLQGSLKQVLLVSGEDHDGIPELDEVRAAVARLGGSMHVFGSAKDYFGALFERGINPLRLATEEERSKLHDMLRTSMTGGISRALTSELRSFLLKEEGGLADTLVRMRANLEACRRTRTEVAEARALEQEISAIYEAGAAMFAASAAGAHAEVASLFSQRQVAEGQVRAADADVAALAHELERADCELAELTMRLAESGARLDARTTERAQRAAAGAIAERLRAAEREFARAADEAARAGAHQREVSHARSERLTSRDRAREAYERAARGLGDLQAGLEELHRRAHAQRTARARLAEAERLLGSAIAVDELEATRARVREALVDVDARRARAERDRALADVAAREHEAARAALVELRGAPLPEGEPLYDVARRELARLNTLELAAARAGALAGELASARAGARAARAVRERAAQLGLSLEEGATSAVERAITSAHASLRASENEAQSARTEEGEAARRRAESRAEAEALEASGSAWEALEPVMARAGASTLESITARRIALAEERAALRAEVTAAEHARQELSLEADRLDTSGGFGRDLLAIRDRLGADLLAARFEASSHEDAAALEAALGPLAHALVVVDAGLAADALAQCADAPSTVWLVEEDDVPNIAQAAHAALGAAETIDVVVKEGSALRVTRKPTRPVLGREARARRSAELRADAERARGEIEQKLERARQVDALLRDTDRLLEHGPLIGAGDPRPRAAEARQREEGAAEAERAAASRARAADEESEARRTKLAQLLEIAAEAHVLSAPDPEARVAELERAHAEAEAAASELERTSRAGQILAERLDALRHAPTAAPVDDAEGLAKERDRLFAAEGALADTLAHKDALAWEDADASASPSSELRASLEAQHEAARAASAAAEDALRVAEAEWERANLTWQTAIAERGAREAACARLEDELAAAGGHDPGAAPLEALDDEIAALSAERERDASRERELAPAIATTRERHAHAERALASARAEAARLEAEHAPREAEWRAFRARAEASGVLPNAPAPAASRPAEHYADARAQRALLVTRLEHARGGADGAAAVKLSFERSEAPDAYLEAWLAARAWVLRRLPTQFATVADPKEALERLRADLSALADRVVRHEAELRGTSEDVARGIDVQLRKTATRVRRLNRDLASVAFGSVGAVRVQIKRVERMELVLRALRGGEVQELLFQSDLPFEEALAEVFRRYGGGGRAGTARILDYREYIDLAVEIKRKADTEGSWELASPTRLSTGEAIGVGAALMMVVLTEWERDANLLRSDRPTGTLRFLFLDEANRLSPDNLAVLFDLCRALDLQLLVAAPEVARAHGNTTYRLVRHVDASGREEVLVTGRRTVLAEGAPAHDAPA